MYNRNNLRSDICRVNVESFDDVALKLFNYQASANVVYRQWIHNLGVNKADVKCPRDIPFLPIQAFKTQAVKSGSLETEKIFRSSGTKGQNRSRNYVGDLDLYYHSVKRNFESIYGSLEDKIWLALLPSYMERDDASLIEMVQYFIKESDYSDHCGFYLNHSEKLHSIIEKLKNSDKEVFIIGVSFALLDWLEEADIQLSENITVIETGGMKGRRDEITRRELHRRLSAGFNTHKIHSEYGMTELFSQAYCENDGVFKPGAAMKVFGRKITDPLSRAKIGEQAALNIIDLYNLDSCAFIATDDIGKVYEGGRFEVLGRLDIAEVRGCNLMVY